jgi:hypothetical protein
MEEPTINQSDQSKDANANDKLTPQTVMSTLRDSIASGESGEKFDNFAIALITIVERLRGEQKEPYQKSQHYPYPFVVDEGFIRKLDKRTKDWLARIGGLLDYPSTVVAEVRFPDLSSSRFITVDELLEKAGDQRDPERLIIEWRADLQNPLASTARIQAVFSTEKPLQVDESQWFDYPVASMDLTVEGHDQRWVENVFTELSPFFSTARLGGIYRPLWIFRNPTLVHIFSWVTSFMVQIIYLNIIQNMSRNKVNLVRQSIVEKITRQPTIETKIDMLASEIFSPLKVDPLSQSLLLTVGAMSVMLVVAALGYVVYPKLVPRAGINIGLASTRYAMYENTFRLVIVTALFSGILVPLIRSWFF